MDMDTKSGIKLENRDVNNMCRVCMDDAQGEFVSICHEVKDETIAFMITECANVEVSESDGLPKQCCERCVEGIYIAFCMRKQCRETDSKLRSLFLEVDLYIKKETLDFETVNIEESDFFQAETIETIEAGVNTTTDNDTNIDNDDDDDDDDGNDGVGNDDETDNSEESDSNTSDSEEEEEEGNSFNGDSQAKTEAAEDDIEVSDGPAGDNYDDDDEEEDGDEDDEDYDPGNGNIAENEANNIGTRCCSCRHEFDNEELLAEHIRGVHEPEKTNDESKPYECNVCYKRYLKKTSLNRHKRMTSIKSKSSRKNKGAGTRCCGCKQDFETEQLLSEHTELMHGPERNDDESKPYECDICYKRYVTRTSLNRHKRKKYSNTRPRLCRKLTGNRCCGCKEKFESQDMLMEHSREVHFHDRTSDLAGLKPIECEICYNRYPTPEALARHKSRIYLEKFYQCTECDKSFVKRTMLRNHERKYHEGVKQECVGAYQCAHCGKTFMQQSTLRNHEKIHLEVKPFECKICSKGFSSKGNLQTHLRLHIDPSERKDKLYECPICLCKFKTANYLEIHARVHTGEKPYKCEYCGKLFAHTAGHKRHLMTHTGAKPHVCKYCGREFANRPNMLIHEKGHLGEKNSTCDLCGKQFVHSRYMKKHRKRHFMDKNRPRAEDALMF